MGKVLLTWRGGASRTARQAEPHFTQIDLEEQPDRRQEQKDCRIDESSHVDWIDIDDPFHARGRP